MPCEACETQFNIFKRKTACSSCHRYYCQNCLCSKKNGKRKICKFCEIFVFPKKPDLMKLKTKDLVFYLQLRQINFAGAVEKEELANLIINHANASSYYSEPGSHSSTATTPSDFDNYTQTFDQFKQTCQNLFTSISDKIAMDLQRTTCFNQPSQPNRPPTTEQPRRSNNVPRSEPVSPQSASRQSPRTSQDGATGNAEAAPLSSGTTENGESNFNGDPGPSGCSNARSKSKVPISSSSDTSSFEEVGPKLDDWEVIEKTDSNGVRTRSAGSSPDKTSSQHQIPASEEAAASSATAIEAETSPSVVEAPPESQQSRAAHEIPQVDIEDTRDENEGINVYPSSEAEQSPSMPRSATSTPQRFISLDDIHSSDDLDLLTVKQLKQILTLNRVGFKGCCEKEELRERVARLWQDHQSAPPAESLPSDDLCKICMDAPIECVFLECGHSVTCVLCGKVLSECPICRSYIVRVVRIFKS